MTAMKNWLEVNDSPVVLMSLLDTCLAVSRHFPAVFKQSFDVCSYIFSFHYEGVVTVLRVY